MLKLHRLVAIVVRDIAVGAGGLRFDPWAGQIRYRLATAATFFSDLCCTCAK